MSPFVASRAIVTSWGAATCFGQDVALSSALYRAGRTAFLPAPMIDRWGERITMALTPGVGLEHHGHPRLRWLIEAALLDTLNRELDPSAARKARIALAVSERLANPAAKVDAQALQQAVEQIAANLGIAARCELFPQGRAGGAAALAAAESWIANGADDTVLVGGAHTYFDWDELGPVSATDRIVTLLQADGFVPGEAAAFLVLKPAGRAVAPGSVRCAAATAAEPFHEPSQSADCMAEGFTAAIAQVGATLRRSKRRCNCWYVDTTNEPLRIREVQLVIGRFADLLGPDGLWETPLRSFGDVGAATLPLFAGLALQAWSEGRAVDDLALLLAGSDGPHRAALLLERTS